MRILIPERFAVIRTLRTDFQSRTFLANDHELERENVVVRIIRKEHFYRDRDRLIDHFSWLIGVKHSLFAEVFDAGLTDQQHLYYVREYLPTSQLFSADPLAMMKSLVSAVSLLARHGRIHGAIKPSNIFVANGTIKVVDASVWATNRHDEEFIHFTAPEIMQGKDLTHESDLYSLGAIFYSLLTGRHLFEDPDLSRLTSKYLSASLQPAPYLLPITSSISEPLLELLSRNPANRPGAFERLKGVFEAGVVAANRGVFVGRKQFLQQALEPVQRRSRTLRVVLIEGEIGIGKSRFLTELRLHCAFRGFSLVAWQCRHNSTNLSPVIEGLNRLLRIAPESFRERFKSDMERLTPVLSGCAEGSEKGLPLEKIVNDLIGLLASFAGRIPVVLAVDDMDLADPATVVFLQQLVFRASEIPMTMVLTNQAVELEPKWVATIAKCLKMDFLRLRIEKLSKQESMELIRFFEDDQDRILKISYFSASNPLFIECYSKSETLDCASGPTEAVSSALSKLTANTKGILQALSVFRRPVDSNILAAAFGRDVSAGLSTAVALGLVEREGQRVWLAYPIVAQRLYASISKPAKARLNRTAFLAIREVDPDIEILAHYAFEAEMFQEAEGLYRKAAHRAYDLGNHAAALTHYERAQQCQGHTTVLSPDETLELARCYEWAGKLRLALPLYRRLLRFDTVQNDPELLSAVYARLATVFDRSSDEKRCKFLELAIKCLPDTSPTLAWRFTQLCGTVQRAGDLSRAEGVLRQVEEVVARQKRDSTLVDWLRASILHAKGDFRGAMQYYQSCIESKDSQPMLHTASNKTVILNNLAICYENVGDLNSALQSELSTYKLAETQGNIPLQIVSLGNLAVIKTKLGGIREAEELFNQARGQLKRLLSGTYGFDKDQFFFSLEADFVLHAVHKGDYGIAADRLKRIRVGSGPLTELHRMFFEIIRCKFFLEIGLTKNVRALLQRLSTKSIFSVDFLQVERALIEAQLPETPAPRRLETLQHAVTLSTNLGTLYQQCELLTSLAMIHLEMDEKEKAYESAKNGLELATKNGYKILEARARLFAGVASEKTIEKQSFLSDAFRLASEMGLPELIAEAAYQIGVLNFDSGNTITAREYLIRSTSVTARLAEGVPNAARAKYLAKSWRREAIRALDRCNESMPLLPSGPFHSDGDKYFADAYRFTMAASAAHSLDTLFGLIEKTMTGSFSRSAVITIKEGTNARSIPIRIKLSPELTQRMELVRRNAKNRVFFDSADDKGKQVSAWIPLHSETVDGGIFVPIRSHESPFTEKEIELLTMMGTIANSALKRLETRQANEAEPEDLTEFHGMIGASKPMKEVYAQVKMAAANTATVLIEGESGTGKELVAKAIHAAGPRAKLPFIAVDCGAIPEGLIESELFGSKKGSFTGAVADRAGIFEAAQGGTIFLDEISNTTPALQAKLLRVIQEREVRRIGETKGRAVHVRLIVASNQNLEALVEAGQFRKDLLYRLKVLHIKVPPLRDRRDDIPMLAHAFLQKLNANNKTRKYLAPEVLHRLSHHKFSGNVRELQNAIERAFFLNKGNMITEVPLDTPDPSAAASVDEVHIWFKDISEGRTDFWSAIHNRYKRRDISREKVVALVDFGLRSTRGSYKNMASVFRLKEKDYRRFMDFLRRNDCLLDFRPYRKAATASRES